MIEICNISKIYGGHKIIDDVSLRVMAGEIFGLVGPDGAGKTSLLRMMTGILAPSTGLIRVLGETSLEGIKESIGYVPQKFSLYEELTVKENLRVIGGLYGQSDSEIEQRALQTLSFIGLLPFADRFAGQLSGGMKQKLALAAGMMHEPKVFFLDEPTAGVDPVSRREFWQMLFKINQQGTTVFVSTSYMDEAELCHRVAFLDQGRLVACDSPAKLKLAYPYKVLELAVEGRILKKQLRTVDFLDFNAFGNKYHLIVADGKRGEIQVREALQAGGREIVSLQEIVPSLEDVFVALAGEVNSDVCR